MPDLEFYRNQSLSNFLNRQLGKRDLEAGILEDRPAAKWKRERAGDLAGGPRNKISGNSEVSLRQLMVDFEQKYNLLLAPWRNPSTRQLRKLLIKELVKDMCSWGRNGQRLLNAAQAVIRNPLARGEYGDNSAATAARKGFNRLLINTGRFFNAIKVRFK